MKFDLISLQANHPVVFYDGAEAEVVKLSAKIFGRDLSFDINLSAPECWYWRQYYNDQELNDLWPLLGLRFKFHVNSERVVEPATNRGVYFEPFIVGENEISVCFSYDEVSNGPYIYWLVGIVSRPFQKGEFDARVEKIKKYWAKNG